MKKISQKEYFDNFGVNNIARTPIDVAKTFELIVATRQFEIQMYWTRTAYFWTLIAAAFAGYFALEASDASINQKEFLGFTIAVIGSVLSFGWGLANKGSKYWHENWENHAQMLEDTVVGPIFKTMLERVPPDKKHKLISQVATGPSKFSVSKVNILFSWFFSVLWVCLAIISLPDYIQGGSTDYRYVSVGAVGFIFIGLLLWLGRTWDKNQSHIARLRSTDVEAP